MMRQAKKKKRKSIGAGHIFFSVACVFMLLLVLKNSEIAIDYVTQGLKLSVKSVIPSLFPFMVISELIVRSGAASALSRPLARPARHNDPLRSTSEPCVCPSKSLFAYTIMTR